MKIGPETVVSFHYTLHDESGVELESSSGGQPSIYLHGANNIIPGLETAMEGKAAGDSFSTTVEPAQAYGERKPDRVQRVPVKHLVYRGKLQAGSVVQLNTSEGTRAVTVVKAGRHSADVDTNHPFAGMTLRYEVEVVSVRDAEGDEKG